MGNITRIYAEREPEVPAFSGRLLVVESDADLRGQWSLMLTEAGYLERVVDSLGDALLLANVETFDLALVNLYAGCDATSMMPAHILQRRVTPTPVGLLITPLGYPPSETGRQSPFAFIQTSPFDVATLLANIAAAIKSPFTPTRRWQQDLVLRFMEALGNEDYPAAPALFCTTEVDFVSSGDAPFAYAPRPPSAWNPPACGYPPRLEICGRAAFSAYLQFAVVYQRRLTCFDIHCYPLARGVAARFTCTYETADGHRHRETGSLMFQFSRGRISYISSAPRSGGRRDESHTQQWLLYRPFVHHRVTGLFALAGIEWEG